VSVARTRNVASRSHRGSPGRPRSGAGGSVRLGQRGGRSKAVSDSSRSIAATARAGRRPQVSMTSARARLIRVVENAAEALGLDQASPAPGPADEARGRTRWVGKLDSRGGRRHGAGRMDHGPSSSPRVRRRWSAACATAERSDRTESGTRAATREARGRSSKQDEQQRAEPVCGAISDELHALAVTTVPAEKPTR